MENEEIKLNRTMYNLITHGILMSRNNNIKELIDVRQTNKSWKEEKKKRMGK